MTKYRVVLPGEVNPDGTLIVEGKVNLPAGPVEVVEDDDGNTYRAVYTIKFAGVVYVLHAFQKKSKSGVRTPAEEIDKVKTRLKQTEKHHAEWGQKQKGEDQSHP